MDIHYCLLFRYNEKVLNKPKEIQKMRQVAEIIHVVESRREEFLKGAVNLTEEEKSVLWLCGVRNQQYYALNELIFMTFEYDGDNFKDDMDRMAAYLESKGHLVKTRRRDVPAGEMDTTDWWAPVKKLASLLDTEPKVLTAETKNQHEYMAMLDGCMGINETNNDISFDEEEWMENLMIWKE